MNIRQPAPPRVARRPPTGTEGMHEAQVVVDGEVKRALVADDTQPLPPAGDARRDEKKRRDDELGARLETIEAALGLDNSAGSRVDLRSYSIENEIASKFDYLRVTNPDPTRAYYWANFKAGEGIDVDAHEVQGWVVISGTDKECDHKKDAFGRRVVGDVLLMWIPLDKYLELRQRDRIIRKLRSEGPEAALIEMGERWRGRINVSTSLNDFQMQRALRRGQARQISRQRFDGMLRQGTVPGL